MLHHGLPPAQRALGLLPHPVTYALPAKDVPALCCRRVLHLLEAEGAFALLGTLDVAHCLGVGQVEARRGRDGRVGGEGQVDPALLGSAGAQLREEEVAVCRVRVCVVEGDVDCASGRGGVALAAAGRRDGRPDVEVALDGELDDEQHAEDLVAPAVGGVGHGAREDVPQGQEALRELVVGAVEVEEGQGHGLDGRRRCQRGQVVGYAFPRAGFPARLAAFAAERVEPPVDELAQAVAQAGERAADEVWQEDGARDVGCSLLDVRELAGGRFHLHQVAVFFAQGPVAWERGEREVEQGCEGAQLGGERVCCASAEEPSVQVADSVG